MPDWNLLTTSAIKQILDMYKDAQSEKSKATFNICSFVSEKAHYENFHSDIIKALLDPRGEHGEGSLFLVLFLDYLKHHYLQSINPMDFLHAKVVREEGRLDIAIFDQVTKLAVIIENKINGAVDLDRQLDRYIEYAEGRGFTVVAIVYLSLNGTKKAPPTEAQMDHLICNIAASSSPMNDLTNGWLKVCQINAKRFQSQAFICQYVALTQSIASMSFELSTKQAFYDLVSASPEHLTAIQVLAQLREAMPAFRADQFIQSIPSCRPFRKPYRYYPHYWIFENWIDGEHAWKLDVIFEEGKARVGFWEPNGPDGYSAAVRDRLCSVGILDSYPSDKIFQNGLEWTFGPEVGSIRDVDQALREFVLLLLAAFCKA